MTSTAPGATREIVLRPARAEDVPAMATLIEQADLPPMFIAEFLSGFVIGEQDREMAGCGGLELYGTSAVIRSVVVAPEARGTGLGRRIAEHLIEAAYDAGTRIVYLFTMDAHSFWLHLGFDDVELGGWEEDARESWQYVVISQNREMEMFSHVHSMARRLD